jgi:hypothetical protein
MAISERDNTCVITWNPRDLKLADLAEFYALLVELHSEVVVPYVTSELYQGSNASVPSPLWVRGVSMSSPLVIQLFS